MGLNQRIICIWEFANNKGADQSEHSPSLISAFVIRLLEIIISKLATSDFSVFYLVCICGDWFESRFVLNPKTGFVRLRPIF